MEKVFCGSAKIIPTKFGDLTKVSFSQKDIDTLQANMNNGWINLVIKEKREKIEGKATHYLEVDNWKSIPADGLTNSKTEVDLPF
jgi:hypothetical protein